MKKLPLMIVAAACVIVFLGSCNLNNDGNTNPQQGSFLVANISPDAQPLSITINGSNFANNFGYGNYTPYYLANAGSYTFSFYDAASGTSPILSNTVSISASASYSYFLVDSFSKLKSSFVQDNFTAPSTDSVYIRFFNLSPNAGALYLKDSSTGNDLYSLRAFNDQDANSSNTSFKEMAKGIYTFQLKRLDSSIAVSRVDTLSGGHVYTIFAKGNVGGTGAQALGIGQITNY